MGTFDLSSMFSGFLESMVKDNGDTVDDTGKVDLSSMFSGFLESMVKGNGDAVGGTGKFDLSSMFSGFLESTVKGNGDAVGDTGKFDLSSMFSGFLESMVKDNDDAVVKSKAQQPTPALQGILKSLSPTILSSRNLEDAILGTVITGMSAESPQISSMLKTLQNIVGKDGKFKNSAIISLGLKYIASNINMKHLMTVGMGALTVLPKLLKTAGIETAMEEFSGLALPFPMNLIAMMLLPILKGVPSQYDQAMKN